MPDDSILNLITQFGAAGLIGVMWLMERRFSVQRNRQLDEAHQKLLAQERELGEFIDVVKANTSALGRLEQTHLHLLSVLQAMQGDTLPTTKMAGERA